jgi:peptidase M23-like protein
MPRPQAVPCSHDLFPRTIRRRCQPYNTIAHLLRLLALLIALNIPAAPAYAAPQLWLPTPPGETWKIIQGYGCGSHNSWDRYSLDLVNADGRTRGAPVRAAADGRIWAWTSKSGTLILDHGGGFYTMYSHMDSAVTTERDAFVARGTVIGAVGERAAHGTPHLHFTAFTGEGPAASGRRSVALAFGEGYDLPEIGGCSQHGGETLVAGVELSASGAGVRFGGEIQPERWYNADKRVEFSLPAGASGFSQSWDHDPGGEGPQFEGAGAGYLQLAQAGEGLHTVQVRFWDAAGQQTLATYGPIGYDVTPPQDVQPIAPVALAAGTAATLGWSAPSDNGSGVAGYRIYIGRDLDGTSEWFTPAPQVEAPQLDAGDYLLRVQPLDYAGNAGAWATIGQISVTS